MCVYVGMEVGGYGGRCVYVRNKTDDYPFKVK